MRVLIVNTADRGGGAERMSMRLLDGLLERDVDAWLTVGVKATEHPRVVPIAASPHGRPSRPAVQALWDARRRRDARAGREDFAFPSTRGLLDVAGELPDVVLAVNLHGGYFDLRRLPAVARTTPVVAKLADSWLFTGHCAVPPACGRWERGCGSCPDLATPPAIVRDRTAANWRRKRRLMARSRLTVTAPSRWMLERARRSLLAPAIEAGHVVPNGVDLDVFSPGPAAPGRARLGIDPGARVLAFVAHGGLSNPYKDGALLIDAARRVADRHGPVELVVVGGERLAEASVGELTIREIPYLRRPERLAEVYRAADLYVHAARDETFCITAAEALACGVPVVAAAGGGLSEVVRDGDTGLVAEPGALDLFAESIERLLRDADERRRMGAAAAADARERFDAERMVDSYLGICSEVVERRAAEIRPARGGLRAAS